MHEGGGGGGGGGRETQVQIRNIHGPSFIYEALHSSLLQGTLLLLFRSNQDMRFPAFSVRNLWAT